MAKIWEGKAIPFKEPKNYELFYKEMEKTQKLYDVSYYNDIYKKNYSGRMKITNEINEITKSRRKCPHMESFEYNEKYVGEKHITLEIDITKLNTELIGDIMIKPMMKNYNKITLNGPISLVHSLLTQQNKINIFVDSVRTNEKKSFEYPSLIYSEGLKDIIEYPYKDNEQVFTQQYCNYMEMFNEDINNIIFTNLNFMDAYMRLYPNFVIVTQPQTYTVEKVGLTRYTTLLFAYFLNVEKVIIADDNICDIAEQIMNEKINKLKRWI